MVNKELSNLRPGEMVIEIRIHNLLGRMYWNRSELIKTDIIHPHPCLAEHLGDIFDAFAEQFKEDICYIAEHGKMAYEVYTNERLQNNDQERTTSRNR